MNVETVTIDLPGRAYPALVGPGLLGTAGERVGERFAGRRCAVISDDTVAGLYGDALLASLGTAGIEAKCLTVPAGEASKSMEHAADLCRRMIREGFHRRSFVVALGGGVIGDLAGFVASIFYRGVPFVQVPTTIVSQVDSSVGGKTGVNAPEGKNLIGAFHQPSLVLADVDTLSTLPRRELHEGFAEVIKHAAIRDPAMFPLIAGFDLADRQGTASLIARNIAIKARIVEEDERETSGTRALLNFGHTIGHAVEAAGGYGRFLHGEAIAIGLAGALDLSCRHAGLSPAAAGEILALLHRFGLPVEVPPDLSAEALMGFLGKDKKFVDGVRFVLLREPGDAYLDDGVSLGEIRDAVERLRAREDDERRP